LPGVIEAEQQLIEAVVVRPGRLSRTEKEAILNSVATVRGSDYCRALFGHSLAAVPDRNTVLSDFSLKLAKHGLWVSGRDIGELREAAFDDTAILEAVATTAVAVMLCTLADGLRPPLDTDLRSPGSYEPPKIPEPLDWPEGAGPHLGSSSGSASDSHAYSVLREQFGFVPNLYRLQSAVPELVEAELGLLESVLFHEDGLNRVQKEYVLLAISAANLNTYCATLHGQVLNIRGIPPEECDRIVEDHHHSGISGTDRVLLDETRKLASLPVRSSQRFETERLRTQGFTELQIVEAVVVSGLANFLNTVQAGVGATPDFPPRRVFGPKDLYPFSGKSRPTSDVIVPDDPDAALVARVQQGDIDVFEQLVRRHSRRVFGALAGLVGNIEDARDATQEVFLKAFENIGRFQGRSKFSTWLTSIAINTGTELLRQRKPSESLAEMEDDEGFRPRQVQKWEDNPEQMCSASQVNDLVREAVLRLPEKYRVAVLLRDINQLSTEEAAAALELSIPALKARVLRGRLMLRESLAPHFIRQDKTDA
jgi:RNA polymerase sigma-70 factor (ECF subfamily)